MILRTQIQCVESFHWLFIGPYKNNTSFISEFRSALKLYEAAKAKSYFFVPTVLKIKLGSSISDLVNTKLNDVLVLHRCYSYKKIIASYPKKGTIFQIDDVRTIESKSAGDVAYASGTEIGLIAMQREQKHIPCSLECNSQGKCNFLPHSRQMYCVCSDKFYGTHCNASIGTTTMTKDFNKIFKATKLLIPRNSDLIAYLQKTENILRWTFQFNNDKIKMLSKRISRITTSMIDNVIIHQGRQNLVIQYADAIQDLRYYYHLLSEYEMADIESEPFLKKEKLSFARYITNPDKLEKYLQMVNYLFIGRHDTPLVNHMPLMFTEMDANKADVCSDKYKFLLDHAYDHLVSLQIQGYITWIYAYHVLRINSSRLIGEYEAQVEKQKTFLDDKTCNVSIPHSRNLESCQGGYYVYSGMKINAVCKDTFFPKRYLISRVLWLKPQVQYVLSVINPYVIYF